MVCVVNFYGGPGSGKSTWAAYFFSWMKQNSNLKVELVREFAKEMVYEFKECELNHNWPLVLGTQFSRMFNLINQVDVIITDSPLLLSCIYADVNNKEVLKSEIHSLKVKSGLDNEVDIFVKRTKEYKEYGRLQSEQEAKEIDSEISLLLTGIHLNWLKLPVSSIPTIHEAKQILTYLEWSMINYESKSMETQKGPQNK